MAVEVEKRAVLPPRAVGLGVVGWARKNLFATRTTRSVTVA